MLEKAKRYKSSSKYNEEKHIGEKDAFFFHESCWPVQKNTNKFIPESVEAQEERKENGKSYENES